MGLIAKWTMLCDGCGIIVEQERRPEDGEWIKDGVTTSYTDEWGPGIPDGWIQIPYDEPTGRKYLFFHDGKCYGDWLRSQGRLKELDEFESAIWIG